MPNVSQNACTILYADDSSIFLSYTKKSILHTLINDALSCLGKWLFYNKLHLNTAKCHYIIFKTAQSKFFNNLNLSFEDELINRITDTKFLDFYIDSQLLWSVYLNNLSTKLARSVGILGTLCHYTSLDILISVYYSLIYSHLQYGIIIWGTAAAIQLNHVKILQKKSLRTIKLKYNCYSVSLTRELSVLLIDELYLYTCSLLMFNVLHNLIPNTITSLFQCINHIHFHNTRLAATGLNLSHI